MKMALRTIFYAIALWGAFPSDNLFGVGEGEQAKSVKFQDPFLGIRMRLPPGWDEGVLEGDTVTFSAPEKGTGYTPRFTVKFVRDQKPAKEYFEFVKGVIAQSEKGMKIVAESPFKAGQAEGMRIVSASPDLSAFMIVLALKDRKYILTFKADEKHFKEAFPLIEPSAASVCIFNVPDLKEEDRGKYRELYQKAVEGLKLKDYKSALESLKAASAMVPDYPELHMLMATVHQMMKNDKDAGAEFETVLKIAPEDFDANYQSGTLLIILKQNAKAAERLEKAVKTAPFHEQALTNLGIIYVILKKYPKAIEILARALAINSGSAETHYHYGYCLEMTKKPDEAESHYKKAIELSPGHEGATEGLQRLKSGKEKKK